MAQLVGKNCTRCGGRIGDTFEAEFCAQCGSPVHRHCVRPPPAPDPGLCPVCGSDVANPTAIRVRSERLHPPRPAKQRHGCLTAWLVLLLVTSGVGILPMPFATSIYRRMAPDFPSWGAWFVAFLGVLNVIFALALLNWKRWGFYGFAATTVLGCGLNVYSGMDAFQAALGLVGIGILFVLLQIGDEKRAWPQLE